MEKGVEKLIIKQTGFVLTKVLQNTKERLFDQALKAWFFRQESHLGRRG